MAALDGKDVTCLNEVWLQEVLELDGLMIDSLPQRVIELKIVIKV